MSEEEQTPDAKVLFRVENEDGEIDVETLWAYSLGDDRYKLDNSPFYAYSVSWEDEVYAPYSEREDCATFQKVLRKSGNRTIRILFDPPIEDGNSSDQILQELLLKGCSYEGVSDSYVAINIPENIDLESIREFLIEKEANWEHSDPIYEDLYPEK